MALDARDSVGACESKTARNGALFSCSVFAGDCDVLAVIGHVGSCEMTLLGFGGLVWTCDASFVGSVMLRGRVMEVIWG